MSTTTDATAGPTVAELAGRLRIAAGRLSREAGVQSKLDGMTPTRLAALAVLESDGALRVGELAERVGISAPTTSRLIECLDERGFIERTADPRDHRAVRVNLSAEGAAGLHAVRELGTGLIAERIDGLDPGARAVLAAALPVLEAIANGQRCTP
ncbi:MarR family winged helix-turn-helix transcriptional regulator [Pseudonocardia sp. GCM10023141]|uniref:MarR family winged helix-turn-helix transcriptional regulator n=1 Tax=Pseudonocardia sp. GCM10023141 TaxID=3252653 RepID=UPI003613C1B8